jgi:hypothetical protein
MANTLTPNIGLEEPAFGDQNWDQPLRFNFSLLDTVLVTNIALQATPGTGLIVNVGPGQVQIGPQVYSFPASTPVSLVASTTNFVFVSNTGAITSNNTSFPAVSVPIAKVFTGVASVISVIDARSFLGGPGGAVSAGVNTLSVTGSLIGLQADIILNPGANVTILQDNVNNQFIFSVNGGSINRQYRQLLSGTLDGVNQFFTAPANFFAGTEEVFVDGILRNAGSVEDYVVIGGNGISFTFAPAPVSKLLINYNPQ